MSGMFRSIAQGMPGLPLLGGDGCYFLYLLPAWIPVASVTEGDNNDVACRRMTRTGCHHIIIQVSQPGGSNAFNGLIELNQGPSGMDMSSLRRGSQINMDPGPIYRTLFSKGPIIISLMRNYYPVIQSMRLSMSSLTLMTSSSSSLRIRDMPALSPINSTTTIV
jgi:hypothetical protein